MLSTLMRRIEVEGYAKPAACPRRGMDNSAKGMKAAKIDSDGQDAAT